MSYPTIIAVILIIVAFGLLFVPDLAPEAAVVTALASVVSAVLSLRETR